MCLNGGLFNWGTEELPNTSIYTYGTPFVFPMVLTVHLAHETLLCQYYVNTVKMELQVWYGTLLSLWIYGKTQVHPTAVACIS